LHAYRLHSQTHKDPSKTYVGITEDLEKRLKEHNDSGSYYSKRYAPWYVETHITFRNKEIAELFEKYLKEGSGQAFMTKRLLPRHSTGKTEVWLRRNCSMQISLYR
jgi:predicted GIY-YIG superfamily endonuclease